MATKTPISALQELMAAQKLQLPIYVEESVGPSFKCTVYAAGITGVGTAFLKKAAKHASAKRALEKLGAESKPQQIIILESSLPSPVKSAPFRNYVGELNEYTSKHGFVYPEYELAVCGINGFFIKCKFAGKEVMGKGLNKKDAKQEAAKNMLELVNSEPVSDVYKVIHSKPTIPLENHEEIISMYKKLAIQEPKFPSPRGDNFNVTHIVDVADEESVDDLKKKLHHHGLLYSIKEIQQNPCVVYVRIKGTDLHFLGSDKICEEAIKKALRQAVETAESGCPLNNDLISLD